MPSVEDVGGQTVPGEDASTEQVVGICNICGEDLYLHEFESHASRWSHSLDYTAYDERDLHIGPFSKIQLKSDRKEAARSLRDIGRELGEALGAEIREKLVVPTATEMSPEQKLMAKEMSDAKDPQRLSDVLTDILGAPSTSKDLRELALEVINAGPDLKLGMKEWELVTQLIERGILAGRATR